MMYHIYYLLLLYFIDETNHSWAEKKEKRAMQKGESKGVFKKKSNVVGLCMDQNHRQQLDKGPIPSRKN